MNPLSPIKFLVIISSVASLLLPSLVNALNLKRSVITALARAEETRITSSQVRQAQLALQQAQQGFASDLSITGKLGPAYQSSDSGEDGGYGYGDIGFVWRKPILDGENRRFKIESAQLQLLVNQYQSRSILERTSMDVIESYLNVVFQQEIVRVHSSHITEFRKIQDITEARRNNGVATEADVLLVRARVISADATLNRARLDLAKSQNRYNILVGPIENDMIIPFLVDDIFFQNFELLVEKLRTQNSELQRSRYQSRVGLADLSVVRSEESVNVFGSVEGKYSNTFSGGAGQVFDAGAYLNLSYKTNLGGINNIKLVRQQERIRELTLLRELLIRDLEFQLQQEYSNYQSLKKVISSTERELQANRGVLEAQKEQQKIGRVELTDILNNQDRVNNSYVRLLQTRQDNQLVRYKLLQLIGELLSLFND